MKHCDAARTPLLLAIALALAGCGAVIPPGHQLITQPAVGPNVTPPQNVSVHSDPEPAGSSSRVPDLDCARELTARGVRFQVVSGIPEAAGRPENGIVQLELLKGDHSYIAVRSIAPLSCETAKALNDWARFGVDRAARQILGQDVIGIDTTGDVACRYTMGANHPASQGNGAAVDVSGFVLTDGRHIIIKRDWQGGDAATREFLRVVFKSAWKRFPIVLGPVSDRIYDDHFHLAQGGGRSCR